MSNSKAGRWRWAAILLIFLVGVPGQQPTPARAQPQCRFYPETAKEVCGSFLAYWDKHGGLAQQGLPMTGELDEVSDTDGKRYRVQYFERAVFEAHPENRPPYDVLLSLLGSAYYKESYPGGAPGQQPNTSAGSIIFPETGKRLGGRFLEYWRAHGGLMQQGYPISDEFNEKNALDGKVYRVQYFERAVFETHPENKPPFDVLLSQLGTFYVKRKYPNGDPDPWSSLRKRPLQLPTLAPGAACPVSKGAVVAPQFGLAYGSGSIYAVLGADEGATVKYGATRQDGGWFYHKVLWIGQPSFKGPLLVRGRQLDGSNELRFGEGPQPANELTLSTGESRIPEQVWSEWPTQTRLKGPGCYAFQVDGPGFTQIVVFKAVEGP